MNYCYISPNGDVELKLGPFYYASYSKLSPEENLLDFLEGFTDIYLDLGKLGYYHWGIGIGNSGQSIFEKLQLV